MIHHLSKASLIVCWALASTVACSQTLDQLGYFQHNGLFSVTGYDHYMLTGAGHIVDVADPFSPQLVGNANVGIGTAVVVAGQYGYFGTGMTASISIVDLTIPSAPIVLGSLPLPVSSGVFDLAVQGDVLFAANAYQGLASIDISDPMAPTLIQQLPLSNAQQSRGVAVNGDIAYVADGSGLLIVDISDPADMEVIGGAGEGYVSVAISEDGSLLAVGQGGGGAVVFDLTNPLIPQLVYGVPASDGPAHSVQILDGKLIVSAEQFGVRAYLMGPSSATLIGSFDNTSNGQSFCAFALDDLLFLTGLVNGAAILGLGSVGISEAEMIPSGLECYPVPAQDILRWSTRSDITYDAVQVVDVNGRTVIVERTPASMLDIRTLAPGRYSLQLIKSGLVQANGQFVKGR